MSGRLEPAQVFQTPWELTVAVNLCAAMKPKRILEVGAWMGGTLYEWIQIASECVTVVDDECRNIGGWQAWAREAEVELYAIHGHSRQEFVIADAQRHAPYDWIFIDADHSYAGVRADWLNYWPMIAEGGAVAFHDVFDRPAADEYGVHRLWEEIKAVPGQRWVEIQQMPTAATTSDYNGIGVVWPT